MPQWWPKSSFIVKIHFKFWGIRDVLRGQPTQIRILSIMRKPPLAPFPKSSNGGLTIWLSYWFVLPSPFCHIAVDKGASATIFTPTRLSFISENQSVDHHSKPFRGRMKGTSQQLRYSFPYPKTTIFVHFLSIFSWFRLVFVYLGSSKHDATS